MNTTSYNYIGNVPYKGNIFPVNEYFIYHNIGMDIFKFTSLPWIGNVFENLLNCAIQMLSKCM